ncbi:MAG: hypothetical protein FWC60_10470 [Firmicutes bacterium]|nr:hypothetical protein [Bacillota bacterium]
MDEHYFDSAERLGLLRTQPEDLVYRYGVKPDKLLTNKNGLAVYQYGSSFYYYNNSGLYATRKLAAPAENYAAIIAKFGLPTNEKTIGQQKYVSYLLRQTSAGEPDKYAYFVFEENKTVASGVIVGTNFAVLSTEATNSEGNK